MTHDIPQPPVPATRRGMGPATMLVRFSAMGAQLDGALYEPRTPPRGAVIYLHGKGGNFYTGPSRFIPEQLTGASDWLALAINMRCRDLAYTVFDHEAPDVEDGGAPVAGGMWEDIGTGHEDIAAAATFIRERFGELPLVLTGHSSGGWYAADYAARHPSGPGAPRATVLLSPLMSNRTALPVWFPDPERLEAATERAHDLVASGHPEALIPLPSWYRAISAGSLVERLSEAPDAWTAAFAASRTPTLLICGGRESRRAGWESLIRSRDLAEDRWEVVDGVGHHFSGAETQVAESVRAFLDSLTD